MLPGGPEEPLLGHYGVHVRCLVAIPLLVIGEALAQQVVPLCFAQFVRTGIVDEALVPRFREVIRAGKRLRDRTYPWVMIGGLVAVWTVTVLVSPNPDEIAWTGDRLGFLARLPAVFAPFTFAVSSVVAASWAHLVAYHATPVPSLYIQMVLLALVLIVLVAVPLLCFTSLLLRTKKVAMLDCGALLAEHGRKVQRRWLAGERSLDDDTMLNAPELGATADTQTLYESVTKIRPVIVNKSALLAIAVPAALPMLLLVAGQYPVKATLLKLLAVLL